MVEGFEHVAEVVSALGTLEASNALVTRLHQADAWQTYMFHVAVHRTNSIIFFHPLEKASHSISVHLALNTVLELILTVPLSGTECAFAELVSARFRVRHQQARHCDGQLERTREEYDTRKWHNGREQVCAEAKKC